MDSNHWKKAEGRQIQILLLSLKKGDLAFGIRSSEALPEHLAGDGGLDGSAAVLGRRGIAPVDGGMPTPEGDVVGAIRFGKANGWP